MQKLPLLYDFKKRILASEPEYCLKDIEQYQKFLYLLKIYSKNYLIPTENIDRLWHLHLEQRHKYNLDCISYMGFIPNHKLSVSPLDKANQLHRFQKTQELWQHVFNTNLDDSPMAFCGFDGDGGSQGGGSDGGNDDD